MSIAEKLTTIAENEQKVYDAGKKLQYDKFWDNFNNCAENWDYRYAGLGWCKMNFRPTKDIVVSGRTFARHGWNRNELYDLAEHLNSLGVKITKMTSARESFMYCTTFSRLPELDASRCTYFYDTFYGMTRLVTIDKYILNTDIATTWNGDLFHNCNRLVNINMEGSIIGKSISFSYSPLSVESMKSIISCLKDFSAEETADNHYSYAIVLSSACVTALEAEGATAEYNGTACTWVELIDNKKWVLG